jgi:hypothetical protein
LACYFRVLVCCHKKNLATLVGIFMSPCDIWPESSSSVSTRIKNRIA